ncbi:hypothetical protein NCCP2716_27470 [Sporosarcina sp. NCCP-2716]|uniref:hypothetical protein n=1 Tax=Sporosarcina sp. NCCP-2716 TaxID=2943679 RepID=UPI0020420D43|nr:hypothetical protein [Sporosarcina sp. NCCP-2716]GKV70249.1 hypothetical protein NCCP2716_27470 [Sporosarcina sp. NCCP-2716]
MKQVICSSDIGLLIAKLEKEIRQEAADAKECPSYSLTRGWHMGKEEAFRYTAELLRELLEAEE